MEINSSAFRHGVATEDFEHAVRCAMVLMFWMTTSPRTWGRPEAVPFSRS
ncbi:MAG: hypothetical protein ACLPUG_10155 [Acidimicrobiales bacterium]